MNLELKTQIKPEKSHFWSESYDHRSRFNLAILN